MEPSSIGPLPASGQPFTVPANMAFVSNPSYETRPLHSYTQSTFAPTSEFTRYLLLALPSRYLFRSLFESVFHNENAYAGLQNPVNKWIDEKFVKPLAENIEKILKDHKIHKDKEITKILARKGPSIQKIEDILDYMQKPGTNGNKAFVAVEEMLNKKGALGRLAPNISAYSLLSGKLNAKNHNSAPEVRTKSRLALRKAVRSNIGHIGYGMALGLGSLALGLSYSYNVYKDMRHLFTEAVAYELDKDPAQVTMRDILNSENKIVNSTSKNFAWKLAERVGLSLPFFAVAKTIRYGLADFTVGLTSARLLQETWNRKPTMFEDLVGFVNHKINPQNGLGQPITVAEIFDIYQHYSYYNQKDKAFKNVTIHNNAEARNWGESQILFERIAQLMNHSYAYKHTVEYDQAGNALRQANFPLPKLIYLLGHGMIDAHDPAKSLAYVEIANKHGIAEVKQAKEDFANGHDLQTVRNRFGLGISDIRKLREHITQGTVPPPLAAMHAQAPLQQEPANAQRSPNTTTLAQEAKARMQAQFNEPAAPNIIQESQPLPKEYIALKDVADETRARTQTKPPIASEVNGKAPAGQDAPPPQIQNTHSFQTEEGPTQTRSSALIGAEPPKNRESNTIPQAIVQKANLQLAETLAQAKAKAQAPEALRA